MATARRQIAANSNSPLSLHAIARQMGGTAPALHRHFKSRDDLVTALIENEAGEVIRRTQQTAGGLLAGLIGATALMILFRRLYPRWWFDFSRELTRFEARVGAFATLLTDRYPSTVDEQSVHLELDYPNTKTDLNRWLPLVKWLLAIPHYVVLVFLTIASFFAVILAWFAILLTGRYPRSLFDFNVGVSRWWLRVTAYAFLLVTDRYPPFSLKAE